LPFSTWQNNGWTPAPLQRMKYLLLNYGMIPYWRVGWQP